MKLEITHDEMDYLITVIEQEVAKAKYFGGLDHMALLHKLYSKLVIIKDESKNESNE